MTEQIVRLVVAILTGVVVFSAGVGLGAHYGPRNLVTEAHCQDDVKLTLKRCGEIMRQKDDALLDCLESRR